MKIKWRKRTEHMKKIASARRIVVTFKRRTRLHYVVLFLNCKSFNLTVFSTYL
ncbi:hypothetical protein HanPI659440_Chr12g0466381 [Helianthus annuus]|nr:hypothetical protein HanPI659440_Chr12g0466381 [Helianthus annuus]